MEANVLLELAASGRHRPSCWQVIDHSSSRLVVVEGSLQLIVEPGKLKAPASVPAALGRAEF